eukprot:gb/GECH01014827.1/.p1 GENE.gb/GECH01014827.1/~~gb/GECH01014827.1/.p1  ORF type:complete len:714 (+),score=149.46 gb/GECH01014827.1/:1-2142(+)
MTVISYPEPRRDDTIENHHGVDVADPYRWMEEVDTSELKEWITKQCDIFSKYMENCQDKQKIKEHFNEMYNYEKILAPRKRGDNYFFMKNSGLQNQYVLYVQKGSLEAKPQILLDPNTMSEDGTSALGLVKISGDGKYIAYGISKFGSDWNTLYVRNVDTAEDCDDYIEWVKFSSVAWLKDSSGFYYTRYSAPESLVNSSEEKRGTETESNSGHKVFFHKLGTKGEDDQIIFEDPKHPKWLLSVDLSDDGKYLVISASEGTARANRVYYMELDEKDPSQGQVIPLIENFDAEYIFTANNGSIFYFYSNENAPRYRLLAIDIEHSEKENWEEIISQSEHLLQEVICVNQSILIASYLENVKGTLKLFDMKGKFLKQIPIDDIGSIREVNANREDSEFFIGFTSFLQPTIVYRYTFDAPHTAEGSLVVHYETKVKNFDPKLFETKQVWYSSKDGTRVPMFLVSKKGLKRDGARPTFMYAYGGFSISITPWFSIFNLFMAQHANGIFALPNIRGGGEFGEEWHEQGIKDRKQNGFDDFIAAGEYLIAENYTSPSKLAIAGDSNGGLLIGAVVNQRPDLFGCAFPGVGVMDMLRFHKFTIGYAWVSDFGCADQPDEFPFLYRYSPLHNIDMPSNAQYPAIMAQTSDHDDRVVPLHTFKYMAELQHRVGNHAGQTNPLLVRIDIKAGHGRGKPTSKIIDQLADVYTFAMHVLDASWDE